MYCKHCGKEMPDDAVMCVGCGKLIDGADAIINVASNTHGISTVSGNKERRYTRAWLFSIVAFILYFSAQMIGLVIPISLIRVIVYGIFMVPILVMAILGMVASVKEYGKIEQRTFMFVMLLLAILFLVQAIVYIVLYSIGSAFIGGLLS